MFQEYFKGVLRVLQGSFKNVSRVFQESFMGVSTMIDGCFMKFKWVSRVFDKKLKDYQGSFSDFL